MPMMPAADAVRAVIGPDDPAAARMTIIGIIAAVEAPMEVAMPVEGGAIATIAMKSAIAIAAAVKGRRGAEATAMKTTAMEAAEMSSATMEAATAAVEASTSTMSAATTATAVANLRDHVVGRSLRRRQRRRIDRSHRFGTTRSSCRQHQRGNGRNPEQAHRACPGTQNPQHRILPESGQRSCDARSHLASSLFMCGRSQD